jgi:Ca2+-binding EF-hand superfamily protein
VRFCLKHFSVYYFFGLVLFPSTSGGGHLRSSSPSGGIRAGSPAVDNYEKVKKNSKGGVLITAEEISSGFQILDIEKNGQLTIQALKKRLTTLFPGEFLSERFSVLRFLGLEMTAKEFRFLMNNKKEITAEDLKELLIENELTQFDPVSDAFKVFDPDNKGVINEDKLRQAFISFGYGELSDEELQVLKRVSFLRSDLFSFFSFDFSSLLMLIMMDPLLLMIFGI